jgi:hypothetical protein
MTKKILALALAFSLSLTFLMAKKSRLVEARLQTSAQNDACFVHNYKYRFEFLARATNSTRLKFRNKIETSMGSNTFLISLDQINDYERIKWNIIRARNQGEVFYLKNSKYGEYLCATNMFETVFVKRRLVTSIKMDANKIEAIKKCQWKVKELRGNIYTIWNVFANEPLYTASFLFKRGWNERNVFLWHEKNATIIRSEFAWIIECNKNTFRSLIINYL